MKKAIFIVAILFVAVISTACINNIAVQELNNAAETSMASGDYDAAIKKLEASLDLDCNMYETYYNLGVAYIESRQFSKAVTVLEKSIKLNSKYPESYYSLGIAQESLADELSESNLQDDKVKNSDGIVKTNYSTSLSENDKETMVENYHSAILNYNKYIDMKNSDSKKEELASHIKDIEKVIEKLEYQ